MGNCYSYFDNTFNRCKYFSLIHVLRSFSNLWGKERRITADGIEQIYYTDFETKVEARKTVRL